MVYIAKHAVKVKADAVIFGGDIFETNNPTEYQIGCLIRVLNILKKANIRVFIMDGNHDKIAKHGRKSCLEFISRLKVGYDNVTLVQDLTTKRMWKAECGDIYFHFLPFLYKSHIPANRKTVQEHLDKFAWKVRKESDWTQQHFVFSHFNVPGVIPGTEADMLKKVETNLPEAFMKWKPGKAHPTIINGHIHSYQRVGQFGNIHIVGSPIFTDFGEKENIKYFLQLDIVEWMDEGKGGLHLIKTPCRPFLEYSFQLNHGQPFSAFTQVILDGIRVDAKRKGHTLKDAVLKVNLTLAEDAAGYDHNELRDALAKKCFYIKPIKPRIIHARVKRNKEQTVKLDPRQAVAVWLKKNKPKDAERVKRLALEYLERGLA